MSLLHNAKRLLVPNGAGHEPFFTQYRNGKIKDVYWFCGGWIERPETGSSISHHEAQCPWESAAAILAVVKAAERLMTPPVYSETDEFVGVPAETIRMVDAGAYDALRAAMQGEKETA